MFLMTGVTPDWAALGWHCFWLSIGGLFAILMLHGAVAQLKQPFPDYGAAAMAAVFGFGLGIWVISSCSDPERPLRTTFEVLRLKRAETERRREVNDFLEQYHPALKAGQEQINQMHAEACRNLKELRELKAQLKHENAAAEIDIAINRMEETESELAAALHRIDMELEELYAAHQLAKIADEGWSPEAVARMKRSAETTLYTAQVANQETQILKKSEKGNQQ